MKIAIVDENYGLGGIQRVSEVIGRSLQQKYEVYFYSAFENENYYNIRKNFIDGSYSKIVNFSFKAVGKTVKSFDRYILNKEYSNVLLKKPYLKKIIDFVNNMGIDVVIVTGPILISCLGFLKENTSCKCVAWIHNNFKTYVENYTKGYTKEFYNGLKSADAAVCLTKRDCQMFSEINRNTYLIYNPLTIENKRHSNLNNKKICFTGRISFDHKGIDYLIEIAKKIPKNWIIEIAGGGTKGQVSKLLHLITKNNLREKIVFKGPLSGGELERHYLTSSIYLMTSRWEGMPLVLAEAMSFGLPIVSFTQSGSSEVLDNGKYGVLIANGDISGMVSTLKKFMNNKALRQKYQRHSLKRVNDFDIEIIIKKWIKLLESI